MEGAALRFGSRHHLHYDWMSGWCFGLMVGMWNVGSLSGKGEYWDKLRNWMVVHVFYERMDRDNAVL